jgi:pilus assembly protein CpaB
MKPGRIFLALAMSLILSGACTWLLSRKIEAHAATQKVADLQYVAPVRSMQAGEVLKADSLTVIKWPAADPIHGAFMKSADVLGRALLYPVEQGQPLLERDVSAVGSGAGLAAKIPDGMRAIALRSDEIVGVAGFLIPGSHVDVLVTYHSNASADPVTATVLQNSEVIAAGQKVEPDPEGKPAAATVVTLLLTPEDSARAVLASTQGTVHFVLRNGADQGRAHVAPLSLAELSGLPPIPTKNMTVPAAPVHRTAPTPEIETILGGVQP